MSRTVNYIIILILTTIYNLNELVALTSDGLSLLSLKSAVDSGAAAAFSDWTESDNTPCSWTGISCSNISGSSEPRVIGVSLAGKYLKGYIPSELGTLTFLRRLNLHDNNFYGSIPDQLFNASSLHSLFLYNNNLSGTLPPSMCSVQRLQNVDVSNNSLSGELPKYLRNCRQLHRLILARNRFSGEIPAGVSPELANLEQLDLADNLFSGSIPEDIGELKSLSGTLNLSFNHLKGELPKSLGDLPLTVSFDLRNNNLSGEIPQTGSFANQGPTAFLNNPLLCGFPLKKTCKNSTEDTDVEGGSTVQGNADKDDSKKGIQPGLIVLISVADAAGVAFAGLLIIYLYWRNKDSERGCSCTGKGRFGGNQKTHLCVFPCIGRFPGTDSDLESNKGGGGSNGVNGGEGDLVTIDEGFNCELDELLRASAYVLGKSGLGIVYKVVLGNGMPVAVRRLGEGGEQRYKEFVGEVQAIGKVKHPNVVKLRAYYWAPDEKLLISDFISNGNLASALHGRTGQGSTLSWSIRLKIAKGTARGLAYLHECSPRKFVHGDIKPSNILLDNDFQPHVSDFGLNRLINITGNGPSSGGLMGGALPYSKAISIDIPNNYRSPEARVAGSRPTQKWDVFSFGVVLLELLTGKSPEFSYPTTSTSTEFPDLVRWVRRGFEDEKPLSDLVDPMLLNEIHAKKEVLAAFHVALTCTEQDPEIRPRMKTVVQNLEKIGT